MGRCATAAYVRRALRLRRASPRAIARAPSAGDDCRRAPGLSGPDELRASLLRPTEGRYASRGEEPPGRRPCLEESLIARAVALLLVFLAAAGPVRAQVSGAATVSDGDTLKGRHTEGWWRTDPPARHRRAGVEADLPRRRQDVAVRCCGDPGASRAHRWAHRRVRRARARPLRALRRGVPCRRTRRERVDGRAGLDTRVPEVLDGLRLARGGGEFPARVHYPNGMIVLRQERSHESTSS